MLLVMCVTLYTSRVILQTLGATDYGVYSVVGGIVVLFSFLSGSLSGATSRYLAFDLGEGNYERLKRTFSASLNIYLLIAAIIVVLGESAGLWMVPNKLTIPVSRMDAAYWVLHFSIITAFFSFSQYPYTAALLAHEDMSIYAYVGIYEAVSKLVIAFFITVSPMDKLVFYALLMMINQILIQTFYRLYASHKYSECRFRLIRDKALYKRLLAYSGYDMLPSMGFVFQSQGVDILLNMFFGPVANAARAISNQVNGVLNQVIVNMIQAARPQVIKDYAQGDSKAMYELSFLVSKFTYLLVLALAIPLFFEMDYIIQVWLGKAAPVQTALFCRIILIVALVGTFNNSLGMPMHAIGKLRNFSIVNSILYILPLPAGYFMFRSGAPDYSIFVAVLCSAALMVFSTLYLLHREEHFAWKDYLIRVLFICAIITALSIVFPYLVHFLLPSGLLRLIVVMFGSELILGVLVWFVAMDSALRHKILSLVASKLGKTQ